jgi:integrase
VFRSSGGIVLRKSNWSVYWRRVTKSVGVEGLHFHDLRHTGNTLAASAGASTKELMSRMGHSSTRAAMLYQHATRERDDAIAEALDAIIVGASR